MIECYIVDIESRIYYWDYRFESPMMFLLYLDRLDHTDITDDFLIGIL